MKENTRTLTFGLVLLFICCYFMRLFAFPNVLTVALGGALSLGLIIQQKRISIDVGICLLALSMGSYYLIVNGVRGLFFMILYIPPVLYVLAEYAVFGIKKDKDFQKKITWLIFALIIGLAVYGILNSYMWFAGYVVPGTRRWQDFWTREIVPGTQHTAYYLPVLASFVPAVLYFKKRSLLNAGIIILTGFFAYSSLATRSRMSIVIFALVFGVQLLLFVIFEHDRVKEMFSDKRFWILCGVLAAAMIAGIILVKDHPIVVAFIENMGKGGGIVKNVRFSAQKMALEQLFVYPMGGRQMELGREFCHNTWLDMANAGGLIPFFAFALYTVYSFVELIRLLCGKSVPTETKMMLTGLYAAFFLYLSVEPALDASIHLVTPWIFVNGLIHGITAKK